MKNDCSNCIIGRKTVIYALPNKPNQQISKDDCSIDDILESAGILTPEQAAHLTDEIRRMREEEWD
ncbi:hypothetical protein WBG83_22295 [Paenibacillus sp. y28]